MELLNYAILIVKVIYNARHHVLRCIASVYKRNLVITICER